ncbi:uncharacterized protein LOC111371479 [Olea europaea var. sylvestris]|uniref:uncharacterized protein LOC111371479 n=1 Tax=Olea europaea var. sylvestris TaxID=158386 RepID=UPI000C1CD012|nr:uncharacterized protein LOC111371479 [Olea europaea var. sylvestris]
MSSREHLQLSHTRQMLYVLSRRFQRLCSKIRRLIWRRPRPKLVIRRLGNLNSKGQIRERSATRKDIGKVNGTSLQRPIRLATFNAALFSLAPAIPKAEKSVVFSHEEDCLTFENQLKSVNGRPKGILKQSPLHPMINGSEGENKLTKPRAKVSINLPENEISLSQNKVINVIEDSSTNFSFNSLAPVRSPICFPASMANWIKDASLYGSRTIFDVLKEVDADILSLQDVKAEEEKDMKPLSDLARALGMNYVFAESWAPEYGNAVLSKWPIKKWKVQKIYDDKDFRNVIKATIDVPWTGELNFYCTQLDHLDENWRMKQINAIIQSNDHPHILAGGINSLDASDYSSERWTDIVNYYADLGKPMPKVEVMKFLKENEYTDAKDFPGECEPVVMIARGQNVQGTCKYGTRVDYILGSQGLPYTFVPGSYSVISSKGTSDHHIVKVDVMRVAYNTRRIEKRQKKLNQRVVKITKSCSSRGIWQPNT